MIFVSGDPQEYDSWAASGCTGWSYQDCLPYFKRLENNGHGATPERGSEGPISVTHLRDGNRDELSDAFVMACQQAGIPLAEDYNGKQYEGVNYLQLSTRDGQRCSTARGHLATTKGRSNLELQAACCSRARRQSASNTCKAGRRKRRERAAKSCCRAGRSTHRTSWPEHSRPEVKIQIHLIRWDSSSCGRSRRVSSTRTAPTRWSTRPSNPTT